MNLFTSWQQQHKRTAIDTASLVRALCCPQPLIDLFEYSDTYMNRTGMQTKDVAQMGADLATENESIYNSGALAGSTGNLHNRRIVFYL